MNGVNIALTGKETNDVVSVSGSGAFSDKNAAVGTKAYTISGLALSGADSSNYYLSGGTSFSGTNGTINKADLTVAGLGASNRVYDATTTAVLTGAAYVSALSGDTVTIGGTAVGAFNDKNVGTGKAVTVSGVTIGGADAGNYNLIQQAGLTANVTKADLVVGGFGASNKVYDATTTATLTGTAAVTALLTDVVNIGGTAVGTFVNKNAGTSKAVTISGITITGGADAGNYNLVQQAGVTADITKADLVVSGLSASNKVYDATTAATITGTASVTPLLSDIVTVGGTAIGTFADANVGTGKAVTVSGVTISGTDAGNYNIIQQTGVNANITKATLTVKANNDAKFVTQSDAIGYSGVSYSGFVGGEDLTQVATGGLTLSRSNAGSETAGAYSGVVVASGLSAGNYQFNYVAGDYTIVPSNQLLVRVNNTNTTYGTAANYTVASAKYWDPTANSGTGGEVALTSITNNGSNNYTINDGAGGVATFTLVPQSAVYSSANKLKVGAYQLGTSGTVSENSQNFSDTITVVGAQQVNTKGVTASTANGASKTYDGTTATTGVSMALSGTEANDVVSVSGVGAFASKNAGTNLTYTISNISLLGGDASDYYLSGSNSFTGSDGVITKKILSLSATKTYDGNTNLSGKVSLSGLVGSETLTYSGAVANSSDAANNSTNYINAIVLANGTNGGLASNYVLPALSHAHAPVTITGGNSNNIVLPAIPVIPPPPPPPSPNILPAIVVPEVTPIAPTIHVVPTSPVSPVSPITPSNAVQVNTAGGQAGGGPAVAPQAQVSGDKTSFEGIKVGATTVGSEVRAIIIQSSSISQTPVALLVTIKPNEGFNFTVPQSVVAQAAKVNVDSVAKVEVVSVAQSDGKDIPLWLTFDKNSFNFKSENVPAGGLPLTVKLLVKNNDTTKAVEIIIRGNGR